MNPLNQRALDALPGICRAHYVARLDLFGSATREDFDPTASDIDVLVAFGPIPDGRYFDTYFDFKDAMEALVDRPVDVLVEGAIRNPYLLENINETRQSLYAA